jgi:hypothetical protein
MIALGRSRNPSSRSSRDGPFTITGVTFIVCYLLLNCQIRGKKGNTCSRRLESVSHSIRHWLDVYKAAIMEFDRAKLPASIDAAESLIHQRLRGLPIANSKERRELTDALNSLAVLKRML